LTGVAEDFADKAAAECAVERRKGVTHVIDNVAVGVVNRRSAAAPDVG
jgi:hypothetical protein